MYLKWTLIGGHDDFIWTAHFDVGVSSGFQSGDIKAAHQLSTLKDSMIDYE